MATRDQRIDTYVRTFDRRRLAEMLVDLEIQVEKAQTANYDETIAKSRRELAKGR